MMIKTRETYRKTLFLIESMIKSDVSVGSTAEDFIYDRLTIRIVSIFPLYKKWKLTQSMTLSTLAINHIAMHVVELQRQQLDLHSKRIFRLNQRRVNHGLDSWIGGTMQ